MDSSKIENELGWFPAETFETSLRETVEWYLNNKDWVNNVTSGAYRSWIETNYGSSRKTVCDT
jgi:dTDP-glucose 4,6-dehydratase